MSSIVIAIEDELSESVAIRLLKETKQKFYIQSIGKFGNGYLRSKIGSFVEMARHRPVLLLTDLDNFPCATALKSEWLGPINLPSSLCFRVAVREIESWLLADHEGMIEFLGQKISGQLPRDPDQLSAPKKNLLNLAKKASRELRSDLVREQRSSISQGVGYNSRLNFFIRSQWSPQRAAERSQSLARARRALSDFAN